MKRLITFICLISSLQTAISQTATDALRYAQTELVGSARSLGVANSMGALGADFSTIAVNPAGLGAYRASEFVITPIIYSNKTSSRISGGLDPALNRDVSDIAIANVGIVIHNKPRFGNTLKTSNFAIGINRTADYNQQFRYAGRSNGSITDRFIENANGLISDNLNGFEEGLGFATGAIYDFDGDQIYTSDFESDLDKTPALKTESVNTIGSKTELSFAYGANLNEKLLFGASVNIPILNYESSRTYTEEDVDESIAFFNDLEYQEFLTTSGIGINFKLGAIYKVDKGLNLGVALHSPTTLSLTDDYATNFEYSYTEDNLEQRFREESPRGNFNYNLKTPWKAIGSLGIVIKKSGFITAEVEWTDFGNTKFNYDVQGNGQVYQRDEQEVNNAIDNSHGSALNFRMGGELAIKKLRIRAGVGMTQSPYTNDNTYNNNYNAGIGFRDKSFYMDLGYQLKTISEGYAPYYVDNYEQPLINNELDQGKLALTLGLRF